VLEGRGLHLSIGISLSSRLLLPASRGAAMAAGLSFGFLLGETLALLRKLVAEALVNSTRLPAQPLIRPECQGLRSHPPCPGHLVQQARAPFKLSITCIRPTLTMYRHYCMPMHVSPCL